jgi:hypothetical protein
VARIQHFKKRNSSYMIYKKYGYNYSTTENAAPLSIANNLGSLSVTTGKINEETTFESINGETLVSISGEEIISIL